MFPNLPAHFAAGAFGAVRSDQVRVPRQAHKPPGETTSYRLYLEVDDEAFEWLRSRNWMSFIGLYLRSGGSTIHASCRDPGVYDPGHKCRTTPGTIEERTGKQERTEAHGHHPTNTQERPVPSGAQSNPTHNLKDHPISPRVETGTHNTPQEQTNTSRVLPTPAAIQAKSPRKKKIRSHKQRRRDQRTIRYRII